MGRVFYCTREEVMDAFDTREAAHRSAQIDSAIASASDDIDGWLNRHKHGLAPRLATRYFDWPSQNYATAYRLWFDENELISATTVTAGGNTLVEGTGFYLEPVNSGPPFTFMEIILTSTSSFTNTGSRQHAVKIVGKWGINDDQKSAGTLAAAVNSTTATTIDVSDSTAVGVGSVLTVDSEKMLVTGKTAITTGQTLVTGMNSAKNDVLVDVQDGTQVKVGEILIIGTERMKIVDIVGNNATVIRAYDGTVLAAHTAADAISALRRLTVSRGDLGTTAATHLNGATVTAWDVPQLVHDLCKAEAITRIEQEFSGYGARVYSDEAERDSSGTEVVAGRGLTDLRKSCARRYKRKFRKAAV